AGRGREPLILDSAQGTDVVGIYPGPAVVAREPAGMLHVRADEVVVATGSPELQPVCPGSQLGGIVPTDAATKLRAAGVDLGRVAPVGRELIRFDGDERGRVIAVVARAADGDEVSTACDAAIVDLGRAPRDVLARMSPDAHVRAAGSAAEDHPLPPAPTA